MSQQPPPRGFQEWLRSFLNSWHSTITTPPHGGPSGPPGPPGGGGGGASGGTPALTLGTANTPGVSATFIREDDTIAVFDVTTPAAIGTAAAGAATTATRRDHVHPTGAGTPSTQAFGDAAATGSGPAAAMTDHKHAMMAAPAAVTTFYSYHNYVWGGDAAIGSAQPAGAPLGTFHWSGPNAETADLLYFACRTAGSGTTTVIVEYNSGLDPNAGSWTTIATKAFAAATSDSQASMTNATIPANRVIRMQISAESGTGPITMSVSLRVKRPLSS